MARPHSGYEGQGVDKNAKEGGSTKGCPDGAGRNVISEIWALGDGTAQLVEVEDPTPHPGWVQVAVRYSAVSWGTERAMLRHGYRGRLGYQASGTVTAVLPGGPRELLGQAVCVYGAPYVGHASRLWVPPVLTAPLGKQEPTPEGAYAGLGAIALHALRLGHITLGQSVLIVGLGMVGQWAVRLAVAAGARVGAADPAASRRQLALAGGAQWALAEAPGLEQVAELGRPDGVDTLLLCVSSQDESLLDRWLTLTAPGGQVVVVGDLPVRAQRQVLFEREVKITVARAAGPGRGDQRYEAGGMDYPPSLVRWTEGRNLSLVAHLLTTGRVHLDGLFPPPLAPHELPSRYALDEWPLPGAVVDWGQG
jgi:threonine dehydrogenase-like Zn-dependent dehydrogenase